MTLRRKDKEYSTEIASNNGMIRLYIQTVQLNVLQILVICFTIHKYHSNSFTNAFSMFFSKNNCNVEHNAN